MADLEAVLADVSYLMAMEKSKTTPAASASKKIVLPDRSIRSVMHKHLQKMGEHTFDKIFNQQLGFLLFKEFCNQLEEPVPQLKFYEEIKRYEKLESDEERWKVAREIYDNFIMKELLSNSHTYSKKSLDLVQQHLAKCNPNNNKYPLPSNIFEPYKKEICDSLSGRLFDKFAESDKYTRFCQWKNYELTIQLTMNDFSVHRIIGRGGFGEVYGCRKADTGKMYAMKCLDKKRIKMKQGESLALNERMMLTSVSGGDGSPFIVCMSYAFHTTDKLCFILDLMNGGDLHYHLSQHGVFSEKEVKFYAAEILCGLEHMHSRFIVYRDLKPANILLDENGHVRISDLGLACDFSKKKPVASVGTHGYMAPEVLAKNVPYDSSADWFSYGCSLFKLLKGHSPFRQNKTKDRHEVDKLTMTMMIELPDSISGDMRTLLEGLLARDVDKRLGCMGRGVEEVKEHPYFRDVDWKQVYMLKYPPPLVPPRGEVNAADAFDIGNFDEDDTKGIKLTESDQEIYKDFAITISERWQQEIIETVFDSVNAETDKSEAKRKSKMKQIFFDDEKGSDLILQGQLKKNTGTFGLSWQTRYAKLYPNRLELYYENKEKDPEVYTMERIESIESKEVKGQKTISIFLRNGNEPRIVLSPQDEVSWIEWKKALNDALVESQHTYTVTEKASKIYGADDLISYKEWQLYISDTFNAYLKRLEPTANYYQSLKLNRLRTARHIESDESVEPTSSRNATSGGASKLMRHSSRSFSNMGDLLDMVSSKTLLNKPGQPAGLKEKNSNLISLLKSTKHPHRLIYSYHFVGKNNDLNVSSDESVCTVDLNNNLANATSRTDTQKSLSSSCLRGIISGRHGKSSWLHNKNQPQSNNTISSLALAAVHATTLTAASATINSNDRQLNKMLNNQSERLMSRIAIDSSRLNTRASLSDAVAPSQPTRKQSATGSLFSFNNLKSHFHYK